MASGKIPDHSDPQNNASQGLEYSDEKSESGGALSGNSKVQDWLETRHEKVRVTGGTDRSSRSDQAACHNDAKKVLASEISQFAPMPLVHDVDDLMIEIDAFLKRGVPVESVYIDLLGESARTLGEYWSADECDFVDVTMGLWRLQEVMREVSSRFPVEHRERPYRPSALFSSVPGDQHSFGALMVEEIFARAGWDSEALIEPQRGDLLQLLAERSFDLVGLTVSIDCPSGHLCNLVSAIRSVSRCGTVKIIVGGQAINTNPDLVDLVGADGTATDACSALVLAERIVVESNRVDLSQP
ncbi:cobalamin B12-binding domain-containing protein [Aurantiacibacter sp. MUD61]|uniref:cobalamin B12-binding domain-containing protein n=1 Tax=Aurantiacibacter sp. MUD61 TaxID=3009083 RepID=UPI0022F13DEE|nr:cobalamin B12-binding domain-containing protein [Aurantiacibacter sp. MUD61]